MQNGTVKWFDNKKGYGFITTEEGEDAFVHYSVINMDGYRTLEQGQPVQVEVEKDNKGLKATSVSQAAG